MTRESSRFGARARVAIAAAAGVLALSLPARALATKCVKPAGSGGCFASIQAAIDAAAPGETVAVRPGIYRETVVVDKSLQIVGTGTTPRSVTIDGGQVGVVLAVLAPGVTIRNLTARNGNPDAVSIAAAGVRLTRVIVRGAPARCLLTTGTDTRVFGSRLAACGMGIDAQGSGLRLEGSSVSGMVGDCVYVDKDGFTVAGSRIEACGGHGVRTLGGGTVAASSVRGTGAGGIWVSGPGAVAVARGNLVRAAGGNGIVVDSAGPVIDDNRVEDASIGVLSTCYAGCGPGEVLRNVVERSRSVGVGVSHYGAPMAVAGNRVRTSLSSGVELWGSAAYEVRGNRVSGVRASCFHFVMVNNSLVQGNVAADCSVNGLSIGGTGNTLRENRATGVLHVGFDVYGGSGHTLEGNVARGTNYPYCDLAVGTTLVGNSFTASACPP